MVWVFLACNVAKHYWECSGSLTFCQDNSQRSCSSSSMWMTCSLIMHQTSPLKAHLEQFPIKDLWGTSLALNSPKSRGILLSQQKCTAYSIAMSDNLIVDRPLQKNVKLLPTDGRYRQIVGGLSTYASPGRTVLMELMLWASVSLLLLVQWGTSLRILWYLRGTVTLHSYGPLLLLWSFPLTLMLSGMATPLPDAQPLDIVCFLEISLSLSGARNRKRLALFSTETKYRDMMFRPRRSCIFSNSTMALVFLPLVKLLRQW